MTARTKAILKTYFNTGDILTETNFADLIDSLQRQAVYDVRDYGVVGDGTTNDTAAIQAALDAAETAGGGIVLGPSSTYLISDTLWIPNYVTLSLGTITLANNSTLTGSSNYAMLRNKITNGTAYGVKIINCSLDGNKTNQTQWQHGIHLAGVTACVVDSCVVHDVKTYHGITINASSEVSVTNNVVYLVDGDGICFLQLCHYCSATNNYIYQSGYSAGSGIESEGRSTTNLTAYRNADISITNNTIRDMMGSGSHGLLIIGTDRAVISGNNILRVRTYGIDVIGCSQLAITGNEINDCGLIARNDANGCGICVHPEGFGAPGCSINISIIGNNIAHAHLYNIYNAGYDGTDRNQAINITGNSTYTDPVYPSTGELYADYTNNLLIAGNLFYGATPKTIGASITYRDKNSGAAATVADGGTIDHNLAAAPTRANVTPSIAGEMATVTTLDATHITVAIKKNDGSTGTTQTIYWEAEI
jgi:hypothetical protein